MWLRLSGTMAVVVGASLLVTAPHARADAKDQPVIEVSVEIWAMQALRDFDFTHEQLRTLRALAQGTASPIGDRDPPKVNDNYVARLNQLHDALVKGTDDDQIDNLRDDVDAMKDDDDIDVDDSVVIGTVAKLRVSAVLKMLSSSQIAGYINAYEDETPDPVESLLGAADDVRGTDDDEAKGIADTAADEVACLIAGLDAEKQKPVAEKVRSYIDRARKMSDGEYKKKHAELEANAKAIVGDVEGFTILRHWLERDTAEMLSNPKLQKAIDARLKVPEEKD